MQKRMISFLCALVLLLGMMPWGIHAEAAETTATPVVSVEKTWVTVGQSVEVDLSVANNPGIIGGIFTVSWEEGLELTAAKSKDAFEELNYQKPSNYKGLSHFFVIITRASILLTFPIAVPDSVCADCRRLPFVDRCCSFLLAVSPTGCASGRPLLLSYIKTPFHYLMVWS